METNDFPTKGNLIKAKNTLSISRLGYDLLDRKRNVLIREIMELNDRSKDIQEQIETTFSQAYSALQLANVDMGLSNIQTISHGIPREERVALKARSIMGVEIPMVTIPSDEEGLTPNYGLLRTSTALDEAYMNFKKVRELILMLVGVENAAYRLAISIKKTQKRANALKNITIPKYEALTKHIQETLEERERDEFVRLKIIKKTSNTKSI